MVLQSAKNIFRRPKNIFRFDTLFSRRIFFLIPQQSVLSLFSVLPRGISPPAPIMQACITLSGWKNNGGGSVASAG
jgi:hypothetical protein